MDSVPPEDLAPEVKLNSGLPVHKALGVYWDASSDELRVRVGTDRRPCTRRGLLSVVSQTYDPLGVVQPFLLPARQLLQQACEAQLGWDQGLSEIPGLQLEWDWWIKSLAELEQIRVPRCVVPSHFATGDVHVRQKCFSIRRRETYIYVRVFCQKDGGRCFTLQSLR